MPPLFPKIINRGLSLAEESKLALQKYSPNFLDNLRWISDLGYDTSRIDLEAFENAFNRRKQSLMSPRDSYHSIITKATGSSPNTDFRIQTYAPQQSSGSIGHLDIVPYNYTDKEIYMPEFIKKGEDLSFSKLGIGDPYTAIGMESGRQLAGILGGKLVSGVYLLQPQKTVGHISNYFRTTPLRDANGNLISGRYSEEDPIENYIRNYYENFRRFPSDEDINNMRKIVSSSYKDSMAASANSDYATSSLPQFFDESGNIRSELLDNDEVMFDLEKIGHLGVPGFNVRILDDLRRPLTRRLKLFSPFIHPDNVLENYQLIKSPNLGIFSEKKGGILKRV